ncbi:MAG: DUF362 domain-containing protein [bacterium]|nr:DUF362 domain-containing protein [bacterium]
MIGGLGNIVRKGNKVLLKPNIAGPFPPEQGATTHPSVIKAMIQLVKEAGGIPVVGDGPGTILPAFEISGIIKVADEEGIEVIPFNKNGFEMVKIPMGEQLKEIYFSKDVLKKDIVISIPKLKTHALVYYTGAIKNMFGAILPDSRKKTHRIDDVELFSKALVDIFTIRKPDLAIMDGIVGMEGVGPTHGPVKKIGVIISSTDSVAIDAVSSSVIGYDPMDIPTIRNAYMRKLGAGRLEQIEILGEQIKEVRIDFKRVPILKGRDKRRFMRLALGHLIVDTNKCKKCKICVEHCPSEAIRLIPYPTIDQKICVYCYCCFELCPEGAVIFDEKSMLGKSS